MDVEIVFTGLCSFLNVNGQNLTMTEPSVILVRTDDHTRHDMLDMHPASVLSGNSISGASAPAADAVAGAVPPGAGSHEHIPYIAFDITNATLVDDATGKEPVDLAPRGRCAERQVSTARRRRSSAGSSADRHRGGHCR